MEEIFENAEVVNPQHIIEKILIPKAKKKKIKLENLQRWWDNQSQAYQRSTKRPGSVKAI